MSHLDGVRSPPTPTDDSRPTTTGFPEDFNPVYIPAAFKKSRKEKMEDQNLVLSRLQSLMQDARLKEEQQTAQK